MNLDSDDFLLHPRRDSRGGRSCEMKSVHVKPPPPESPCCSCVRYHTRVPSRVPALSGVRGYIEGFCEMAGIITFFCRASSAVDLGALEFVLFSSVKVGEGVRFGSRWLLRGLSLPSVSLHCTWIMLCGSHRTLDQDFP